MAEISVLHQRDVVRLDKNHLIALYAQMDETTAEEVISSAMEELATRVADIRRDARSSARMAVRCHAEAVSRLARSIGLTSLSQVARDVASTAASSDAAAYGATVARLLRVTQRSLTEVWDIHDVCL